MTAACPKASARVLHLLLGMAEDGSEGAEATGTVLVFGGRVHDGSWDTDLSGGSSDLGLEVTPWG